MAPSKKIKSKIRQRFAGIPDAKFDPFFDSGRDEILSGSIHLCRLEFGGNEPVGAIVSDREGKKDGRNAERSASGASSEDLYQLPRRCRPLYMSVTLTCPLRANKSVCYLLKDRYRFACATGH